VVPHAGAAEINVEIGVAAGDAHQAITKMRTSGASAGLLLNFRMKIAKSFI
jgi:pentose-5-phosphate-3-epimerase